MMPLAASIHMTFEHSLQPAGISCMVVFAEGGKLENLEEKALKKRREPTQTRATYRMGSRN